MIKNNQILCFMDYETSGVDTCIHTKTRPIEIGCVFTDNEFNIISSYTALIKWESITTSEGWSTDPGFDGSFSEAEAFRFHKIDIESIRKDGIWPYVVRDDLKRIIKHTEGRKPVIISDAPNFEMFWTRFIFGACNEDKFPFHYNAWSIYPTLQMFNIDVSKISEKHSALVDARSMRDAMLMAHKQAKYFEHAKKLLAACEPGKKASFADIRKIVEEYENEN